MMIVCSCNSINIEITEGKYRKSLLRCKCLDCNRVWDYQTYTEE